MADLRQIFIENLKHYRKQSNLRQLDLALEISKSSNYINSVENGKYFPSPETIDQIAAVLKIDPQKLFDSTILNQPKKNTKLAEEIFFKIENQIKVLIEKQLDFEESDKDGNLLAKDIFEKIKPQIIGLIEAAVGE